MQGRGPLEGCWTGTVGRSGRRMRPPGDILEQIVETKRGEVEALRRGLLELRDRADDAPPARDFVGSLAAGDEVSVIAEIKRRSPGAGPIRTDLDPLPLGSRYESGGGRRTQRSHG